jgi:hypothetical protein
MINSLDNNNTTVHSIVHIVSKEVYLQMKHDQKIMKKINYYLSSA